MCYNYINNINRQIASKESEIKLKSFKNNVEVQGYLFNFGNDERRQLKEKVTGPASKVPGTEFIQGDLNIATDPEATNVVTVRFDYLPRFKKDGGENDTYKTLAALIEANKTFETCGLEASKIRVSGNLDVNDFWTREGELASPKYIRGSFVHLLTGPIAEHPATFDIECVISQAIMNERDNEDDYMTLKGYTFDFRGAALPFDVNARMPAAIEYFENMDISNANPLVTELRGNIVSSVITHEEEVESAFGEPMINTVSRSVRTWDVTWAAANPMDWDDESTITKAELKKALQEREEMLAAEKKRQDEWKSSQGSSFKATPEKKATDSFDDDDDDEFSF